jgi:2,3-bisphosphoglycerate-independent phosphoglycerate mutase
MARKYVLIIPDGAADEPVAALGGKTPLQLANIPEMDRIAREGVLGRSRNVPDKFLPGSDVATLCLFGYDPLKYYTGRAPLEAAAMGIKLGPDDWAVRCNLMTVLDGKMTDFTAGHISSEDGAPLIEALGKLLTPTYPQIEFHAGVSYRNAMVYRGKPGEAPFDETTKTTPPHDVPDLDAADYLPVGKGSDLLRELMTAGSAAITNHPINLSRLGHGKKPANQVWLWGQGKAPQLPDFQKTRGLKGAILSAVDLVRGVGMLAGWDRVDVPGATGYLDTDYAAKGRVGIEALKDHDIVCIHVEAPDEASHEGRADAKIEAIERIDRDIVGPVHEWLRKHGDYRILVSPDHSTMLRTKAHDRAPVAWAMCGAGLKPSGMPYDEISAASAGGPSLNEGHRLMDLFLND